MRHLLLLALLCPPQVAHSYPKALSPVRGTFEDYRQKAPDFQGFLFQAQTVYRSRKPFDQVDWSNIPSIDPAQLQLFFQSIKEKRILFDQLLRQRRLPWLFPDSGCFARAEVMSSHFEQKTGGKVFKIFAFGNLLAKTDCHKSGWVRWWYHVAPIVRSEGELYVLDPSLLFERPMTLHEWLKAMNTQPEIAVCNPHAYDPNSACNHSINDQYNRATQDLSGFLDLEWNRLIELGKNPDQLLMYYQ